MATPSPWDLDFADSRKAAQKHLGHTLEILRPLIRFSHEYLNEIRGVSTTELDQAVAMAFRQCLEFADAVDILLRHMAVAPAAAQARGALEHAPQVIYLARKRDPVLAAAYLLSSLVQMEHELKRKQKAPGLDDEDREMFQTELGTLQALFGEHARDRAAQEALTALKRLRAHDPWYSIRNGPGNVHALFAELEITPFSQLYSDLNPIVHGGMPLLAIAAASGEPGSESSLEWLRPLRVPNPWAFRPIRAASMGVSLSLLTTLTYFAPRLPEWIIRLHSFRDEHNRRCERAEMPDLAL